MAEEVRVRLSAEGVNALVQEFKKVQEGLKKTDKTAKDASTSMGKLKSSAAGVTGAMRLLGVVAGARMFMNMAKDAVALAANLGALRQKTGMTVDTLSTLSYASRTASLSQEQLSTAMVNFSKVMAGYDTNAKGVREATQNLFGDRNALQGLNQDQRFLKIADALSKLEPGARRAGLAMQFFGRSGAELLPLIDELGGGGFDELRAKAEKLGLVMDEKVAAQAQQTQRAFENLKTQVQGLAFKFATGLTPAITGVSNAFTSLDNDGTSAMERIGNFGGEVLRWLTGSFINLGFEIRKVLALFTEEGGLTLMMEKLKGSITGGFEGLISDGFLGMMKGMREGVKKAYDESQTYAKKVIDELDKQQMERLQKLFEEPPLEPLKPPKSDSGYVPEDFEEEKAAKDNADRLAKLQKKADEDLRKAKLDREARLQSAMTKWQEDEEKERYGKGLISLKEYYAKRKELAENQGQAEAWALRSELERLQTEPLDQDELPEAREAAKLKAATAYHDKIIQNARDRRSLEEEEARETEALQEKALEFERYLARLQMDRFAQAREDIAAEAQQLEGLLAKLNVNPADRARQVAEYQSGAGQQVDFAEIEQKAQDALDEIDRKRRQIELEVDAGLIYAFQGEQRIMELEQQRLPLLQQIADEMRGAAINPDQIRAAEDFQEKINGIAVASNAAALEMAKFKQNLEGSLTSDLQNWFASGIQGAEGLKDAFRGLALSVVQSLQQIAAQILATAMMKKLLGGVLPGFAEGGQVSLLAASGGYITGPGTGTSDSIQARLSNGEYVVRAAAVAQPGIKELLDDINYGMMTVKTYKPRYRFADGGLVDVPSGDGAGKIAGLDATLALDRGLLLKDFKADPEFARLIVSTIGNNKKGVKGALS